MLRVTAMTNYQAFRWLWRNDPEAKWFWFLCFLQNSELKIDVEQNLMDFNIVS